MESDGLGSVDSMIATVSTPSRPRAKLYFFRPTLGQGGADRVAITLLREIDRSRFDITIVLMRKETMSAVALCARSVRSRASV